jgi:hypothetical protein
MYRIANWFLACSMLTFGVLKFVAPFKDWYAAQISLSGLGSWSYAMGIGGEIIVGIFLVATLVAQHLFSAKQISFLSIVSYILIAIMMATGIYVHLQPMVPAEVLPLKLKPPFIPGFFLLLAIYLIGFRFNNKRVEEE